MNLLLFNRKDLTFIESHPISEYEITLDAIIHVQSTFTINAQVIKAKNEDIAILHEDSFFYIGVIKQIESEGIRTKISTLPFSSILDVEVKASNYTGNIGEYIRNLILQNFINHDDPLQNMPYLVVYSQAGIVGEVTQKADSVESLSTIVSDLNKRHGVRISTELEIINGLIGHINLFITEINRSIVLKSNLHLLRNLVKSKDSNIPLNKAILYGDGLETKSYYLYQDGTVGSDKNSAIRIYPVSFKYFTYKSGDIPLKIAEEKLLIDEYNHAISFDIELNNRIFVPFKNVYLGDEIIFIDGGTALKTILSQIKFKNTLKVASITLGEHRLKLTEKLKLLERR